MTIEEKAKAYDEALKVLHKYDGANIMFTQDLKEEMFPELKESEDERIKNEIINFIKENTLTYTKRGSEIQMRWIAWLEKRGEQQLPIEKLPSEMKTVGESLGFTTQEDCDRYNQMVTDLIMSDDDKGEQKPAWSEEDVYHFNSILSTIECCKAQFPNTPAVVETYNADANWLKSIKDRVLPQPMQEWSEDDKNRFTNLIYLVNHSKKNYATKEGFIKFINKFKFLRPQNTWKPSDEQMDLIAWCKPLFIDPKSKGVLESLYQDLKKLREE